VQVLEIHCSFFWRAVSGRDDPSRGPVGDRHRPRKYVIYGVRSWVGFHSTLMLPYSNLFWTCFFVASASSLECDSGGRRFLQIIVLRAGTALPVANRNDFQGLFFGLAFGMGGVGAAFLGPGCPTGRVSISSISLRIFACHVYLSEPIPAESGVAAAKRGEIHEFIASLTAAIAAVATNPASSAHGRRISARAGRRVFLRAFCAPGKRERDDCATAKWMFVQSAPFRPAWARMDKGEARPSASFRSDSINGMASFSQRGRQKDSRV